MLLQNQFNGTERWMVMGMREKLIKLLGEVQYLGGLEEKIADHLIANGVTIPVRCKDCKWRKEWLNSGWFHCCNPYLGMASGVQLKDDDFCSCGERKDNETV